MKYRGYVSDECSWGVTVHWTDEPETRVEEYVVNDYGTWDEIREMLDTCNVAPDFETYYEATSAEIDSDLDRMRMYCTIKEMEETVESVHKEMEENCNV